MSFKNKYINIVDWTGAVLLNAQYDSKEVDKVLDANRCDCGDGWEQIGTTMQQCSKCDGTHYSGDFDVSWEDESDKDDCNVYEYIDY